jgi:two-component system, LytTR family, sensor kinase
MNDALLAVLTLGFAAGTALFAVLGALAVKARRIAGRGQGVLGLAAVGLLWNGGRLVEEIAYLAGAAHGSPAMRFVNILAFSSTALLPPVVLLGLEPMGWDKPWRARANRWLRAAGWVTGAAVIAALFASWATGGAWLRPGAAKALSAYNLCLHVVACVVVYRGAILASPTVRAYARSLAGLTLVLAATLVLVTLDILRGTPNAILSVVSQLSSIPFGLAALMIVARFRFADVFVRRSATLLAAIALATTVTLLVAEPLAGIVLRSATRPRVAEWVVTAAVWGVLLLVFPRIEGVLGRAAGRWLFRRPDYGALILGFDRLEFASEREVLDEAVRCARAALDGVELQIIPADGAPGAASGEERVPVWSGGTVSHVLAVRSGEGGRGLLSDEMAFLSSLGERTGRRVEALRAERERREVQLREANLQRMVTEARLRALRAQLNPHFLFNTLNTILDLIDTDPARAEGVTERLADVLRYVLARTDRELIPVGEEFDFLAAYLEIERARFGARLRVELSVDPDVAGEPIPPLILQPLVENAVRHGLGPKPDGGVLRVLARPEGGALRLTVEDDGVGWATSRQPDPRADGTGGIGVPNVAERLRALYGGEATMMVTSEPGRGARVEILIPRREREDSDRRRRSVGEVAAPEAAEWAHGD